MNGRLPHPHFFGAKPAGIALVVTLFLLVTITVLVVGFAASMRTERAASHSMWANEQTKIVADTALAHAVSLLSSNIPSPSTPGSLPASGSVTNWTVNPGRLTLTTGPVSTRVVDLHTGEAASNSEAESVNLNAKGPVTGNYAISSGGEPMRVKWLPVLTNAAQGASKNNPINGRYAFWIDDESARINFNVAGGKPTSFADTNTLLKADPANPYASLSPRFSKGSMTYILGHPASINLDVLGGAINPLLYTDVYSKGFLRSPESIRSYANGSNGSDFYDTNRFFLTAFSRSPEFNVFGKSRIFPTNTTVRLNNGPYYQQSADDSQPMNFWSAEIFSSSGPVRLASTDRRFLDPLRKSIVAYLQRRDWPGMPAQSFVDRWATEPGSNPTAALAEADQVALNLVARGAFAGGTAGSTAATPGAPYSSSTYFMQHITELNNAIATDSSIPTPLPPTPDKNVWYGTASGLPMLPEVIGPRICSLTFVVTPEAAPIAGSYYFKCKIRIGAYMPPDAIKFDAYQLVNNSPRPLWLIRCPFFSYSAVSATTSVTQTFHQNSLVGSTSDPGWNQLPLSDIGWSPTVSKVMEPDTFQILETPDIYLGNYTYTNNGATSDRAVTLTTTASKRAVFNKDTILDTWVRMGGSTGWPGGNGSYPNRPVDLVPIFSPDANSASALYKDKTNGGALRFNLTIPISATSTPTQVTQSYTISDPRLNGIAANWTLNPTGDGLDWDTPTQRGMDGSKYRHWDLRSPSDSSLNPTAGFNGQTENGPESDPRQYNAKYPVRSTATGMFSFACTGMQHGQSWQTVKLQPQAGRTPPDWLLLDLLGPSFMQSNVSLGSPASAEMMPISYMNSTAGKININTKIYPDNPYFKPMPRTLPLQALFKNMPNGDAAWQGIVGYQNSGKRFDYVGQVCEASGVADAGTTEYDKEMLVRHLVSCMTTQSNTFGVYGVAQSVKKNPGNTDYGNFQTRDIVSGEKRFYAVVERYVWPGRDGVPGNGHVSNSGTYDRLATSQSLPGYPPALGASNYFAPVDGPYTATFPVTTMAQYPANPSSTSDRIDLADNPAQALMKYRVIYFQYLTD